MKSLTFCVECSFNGDFILVSDEIDRNEKSKILKLNLDFIENGVIHKTKHYLKPCQGNILYPE